MTDPYYSHAGITIYHGDCRDILPELEPVDLVLTDPPYGINFRSNHRTVKHDYITGDGGMPLDVIRTLINRMEYAAYFFCRWDRLHIMPFPKSVLVWVKNNWSMGDLEHEHGRQWEACCFYPGEKHKFRKRIPDVIHRRRTGNHLHPTEKPVYLMTAIIDANESPSILDPFMGSGTTLVAAKDLGAPRVRH